MLDPVVDIDLAFLCDYTYTAPSTVNNATIGGQYLISVARSPNRILLSLCSSVCL